MTPEVERVLAPHLHAVENARILLDTANSDPHMHPLDVLPAAGNLIRTMDALIRTMTTLLDTDLTEPALTLRIQGRIRALRELQEESSNA